MPEEGKQPEEVPQTVQPQGEPPKGTPPETQPDEVERLRQEAAAARAEAERWKKTHQTFQREVVAPKDEKIRRLEAQLKQTPSGQTIRQVAEALESGDPAKLRQEADRLEQMEYRNSRIAEEREKMEQKIRNAGHDPNDAMFDSVYSAFDTSCVDGEFARVDNRLDRVLSRAKKPETQTETGSVVVKGKTLVPEEEERIARQWLDKQGKLKQDGGSPSTLGRTFTDIEADYVAGRVSWSDYQKERQKRGM